MNVSLQKNDNVSAVLTINMVKADYAEAVEKQLKKVRKDAQMPGFRKGMVPMSLIKKMYQTTATVEEVNRMLGETVNNYIQENNLHVLGEPLPNEGQQQIDFDTMDSFDFMFDLAIAPEVKVEANADIKVAYYDVEVTDEMVDNQCKLYTQRNGKYESVDAYEGDDMLKGNLVELDENGNAKEGGISVEGAVMMPSYIKNDDEKKKFEGVKKGDTVVFNPSTAWDGNAAEISSLLKIEREAADAVKSNFSYAIEEITRFIPGELDQTIFDDVLGKDVVNNVEDFKGKVKEVIAAQFGANADFKFLIDVRKALVEKAGKMEYSETLLKRIMKANNPDKDDNFINENYDKSIEELSWQLVRDELLKTFEIKVENEEIVEAAKAATRAQFAQYGMLNIPENMLDNYAKEMLKKRETIESLAARVIDNKLAEALKEKVTLEHQSISAEDFGKLFQ